MPGNDPVLEIGQAPACMRCRGLARSLAAGPLVARRAFWLIDRLLVPDTRVKFRFPGSSCVPGLPPAWCPSPAVTYFYCPEPRWHKGLRALISTFFRCPQNVHSDGHVVPRSRHFSTGPSTTFSTPGWLSLAGKMMSAPRPDLHSAQGHPRTQPVSALGRHLGCRASTGKSGARRR